MGADLIVAWCDAPDMSSEAFAEAVRALDDERLLSVFDEWTGGDDQDAYEPSWQEATRQRLIEAYASFDGTRDVIWLNIHGHDIVLGGGTSWGDTPEGFTDVILIAESGIGQKQDDAVPTNAIQVIIETDKNGV